MQSFRSGKLAEKLGPKISIEEDSELPMFLLPGFVFCITPTSAELPLDLEPRFNEENVAQVRGCHFQNQVIETDFHLAHVLSVFYVIT